MYSLLSAASSMCTCLVIFFLRLASAAEAEAEAAVGRAIVASALLTASRVSFPPIIPHRLHSLSIVYG